MGELKRIVKTATLSRRDDVTNDLHTLDVTYNPRTQRVVALRGKRVRIPKDYGPFVKSMLDRGWKVKEIV